MLSGSLNSMNVYFKYFVLFVFVLGLQVNAVGLEVPIADLNFLSKVVLLIFFPYLS